MNGSPSFLVYGKPGERAKKPAGSYRCTQHLSLQDSQLHSGALDVSPYEAEPHDFPHCSREHAPFQCSSEAQGGCEYAFKCFIFKSAMKIRGVINQAINEVTFTE